MIKESERSSTVFTANWKETVELKRTLSEIARSKKTIEHSMYLDQKILYKRFQTKLHQSQLFISRLKGDKNMERELRAKTVSFNTNCGANEEDDRKLKRILRRPTTSSVYGSRPVTRSMPREATISLVNGAGLYRSKSVDELGDPDIGEDARVTFDYRQRGSLTSLPGTPLSNNSQVQYLDTSKRAYETQWGKRPHTIQGLPQQQIKIDNGLGDRPGTVAALLEDEGDRRRRIISQINASRIKSANFDRRVNRFCESINDVNTKTDNAQDYYNIRLRELHKNNKRKNVIALPKTPENEYWRHVGDYRKRPITFRSVNHDVMNELTNPRMTICAGTQTEPFDLSEPDEVS